MGSIFRRSRTIPIPPNATITSRRVRGKLQPWATWATRSGTQQGRLSDDQTRVVLEASQWTIEYVDADGQTRRVPSGTNDKQAATQILAKLTADAAVRRAGLIDRDAERRAAALNEPIGRHVQDFLAAMRARGVTRKHVESTERLLSRLLEVGGIRSLAELSTTSATRAAAKLRDAGLSARTVNSHVIACRSFARWVHHDRRVASDPLLGIQKFNEATDRRLVRRELTPDEFTWLVQCTRGAGPRFGLDGQARAMLYQLAAGTGLRSGELRSLTRASFNLTANPPTARVAAGHSKRRREDTLPLHPALAGELADWLPSRPEGRLFPLTGYSTGRLFRLDAEAARAAWLADSVDEDDRAARDATDFLKRTDAEGGTIDFHALRHYFVSRLVRSGVNVKTCQQLARHSTVELTVARYSHATMGELQQALPNPVVDRRLTGTPYETGQNVAKRGITASPEESIVKERNCLTCQDLAETDENSPSSGGGIRTPDTRIMIPLL